MTSRGEAAAKRQAAQGTRNDLAHVTALVARLAVYAPLNEVLGAVRDGLRVASRHATADEVNRIILARVARGDK